MLSTERIEYLLSINENCSHADFVKTQSVYLKPLNNF